MFRGVSFLFVDPAKEQLVIAINKFTGLPYNPRAYVPGGSSQAVAKAIQDQGYANPTDFGGVGSGSGFGGPGSVNIPGFSPDFKQLVSNDALYGQTLGELGASSGVDRQGLLASLQRGLVGYGGQLGQSQLMGLPSPVSGLLNEAYSPETQTLIAKNNAAGMSMTAKLDKQLKDNIRAIRNSLAARGGLRSGELGHQLRENEQAHREGTSDAVQQLLDFITGGYQQYLGSERQREQERRSAALAAADRQAGLPQNQPRDGMEFQRGSDGMYRGGGRTLRPTSNNSFVDTADGTTYRLNADGTITATGTQSFAPAVDDRAQQQGPAGVPGGLTASPDARQRRQMLEGLLF